MESDEKENLNKKNLGVNEVYKEGRLVRYVMNSPVDRVEAERLHDKGAEYIDSDQACCVVIDLHSSTEFSSEARKIWVEFLKNAKIKKTAIFGGNVFVRTLASFVITATGKENIKFFQVEEKALDWLKDSDGGHAHV